MSGDLMLGKARLTESEEQSMIEAIGLILPIAEACAQRWKKLEAAPPVRLIQYRWKLGKHSPELVVTPHVQRIARDSPRITTVWPISHEQHEELRRALRILYKASASFSRGDRVRSFRIWWSHKRTSLAAWINDEPWRTCPVQYPPHGEEPD